MPALTAHLAGMPEGATMNILVTATAVTGACLPDRAGAGRTRHLKQECEAHRRAAGGGADLAPR
jgi:hypothetical protein